MFHWISKSFRAVDDFLQKCEDYLDLNVRTGKIFKDIPRWTKNAAYIVSNYLHWLIHTAKFRAFISAIIQLSAESGLTAFLIKVGSIVLDGQIVFTNNYAELFALFAGVIAPSTLLLFALFEYSPIAFYTILFPLLIINSFFISSVFLLMEKREKNDQNKLRTFFLSNARSILSSLLVVIICFFVVCDAVAFLIFILYLSSFLTALSVNTLIMQFVTWFVISFLSLFIFWNMFIFLLFSQQVYLSTLIDKDNPRNALLSALGLLKANYREFLIHSAVFTVIILSLGFVFFRLLSDIGLSLSVALLILLSLLLQYLLRRRFVESLKNTASAQYSGSRYFSIYFFIIFITGIVSYLAVTKLTLEFIPKIQVFMRQEQIVKSFPQDFISYQDKTYGYIISYPKAWDFYRWQPNWVRFYTNFTGTYSGAVWIDIIVYPLSKSYFYNLSGSAQGLFSSDPQTYTAVAKITNLSINGYDSVKYTVSISDPALPENQTHYMIHKGNYAYDISLVTHDRSIEQSYSQLFTSIINSFQFTQQNSSY